MPARRPARRCRSPQTSSRCSRRWRSTMPAVNDPGPSAGGPLHEQRRYRQGDRVAAAPRRLPLYPPVHPLPGDQQHRVDRAAVRPEKPRGRARLARGPDPRHPRRPGPRRGGLALARRAGWAYAPQGGVRRARAGGVGQAGRLLFTPSPAPGWAPGVVRPSREQQLTFPPRHQRGPRRGELFFQPLTHDRVLTILHNPAYAGAYAYGRAGNTTGLDGHHHTSAKPIAEWTVLIKDHHPGYLTWPQYEANLAVLASNAPP